MGKAAIENEDQRAQNVILHKEGWSNCTIDKKIELQYCRECHEFWLLFRRERVGEPGNTTNRNDHAAKRIAI